MKAHPEWCPDVCGRQRVREGDTPRQLGRLTVAAACHEAPDPTDRLPEHDPGGKRVAGRPDGKTVAADVPKGDADGGDQAAVEDAP